MSKDIDKKDKEEKRKTVENAIIAGAADEVGGNCES